MTALNKRAFSLVEMLVVIAIAAIMLAAGVYYLSALNPRKVEAEAIKLISELNRARQAALGRHQNYTLTFDLAEDSYQISSASSDERQTNSLAVDLASVTDFSGSPENQLVFYYPKGIAQDRIISLSSSGLIRRVRVFSETGYVRIE